MASCFDLILSRATVDDGSRLLRHREFKNPIFILTKLHHGRTGNRLSASRISANGDARDSYFDMWKKAVDQERKSVDFERLTKNSSEAIQKEGEEIGSDQELEKKRNAEFEKLLYVSDEERDRVQRMQVIDRAAAAISAARALLKENLPLTDKLSADEESNRNGEVTEDQTQKGNGKGSLFEDEPGRTPGPSFWSWLPPPPSDAEKTISEIEVQPARQLSSSLVPGIPFMEKERELEYLSIPFETSTTETNSSLTLPPLESLVEVSSKELAQETPHLEPEQEIEAEFSMNAAEVVDALSKVDYETPVTGVTQDGTRWWKETGVEQITDGVVCKWTLTRGVSADGTLEWENKYWEAANELGYKELGSEKSGRDAAGNVWREYWKESMTLNEGSSNIEKTANKWGKNAQNNEWQEQWFEHYDASGRANKWAHKWCSIDPTTPVDAGHAHIWHERWGEEYDGEGGSVKYTDKWAERSEGEGWSKWGDKWDEHFDREGHGVKQGESWWEGKYGDRWNRTWGEGHNGTGWVHKYGKSSSGEHWDTHVQQETWYEKFPHFGFQHCFDNSTQLREVKPPSEWPEVQ